MLVILARLALAPFMLIVQLLGRDWTTCAEKDASSVRASESPRNFFHFFLNHPDLNSSQASADKHMAFACTSFPKALGLVKYSLSHHGGRYGKRREQRENTDQRLAS